jgi:hypothetical protein
LVVNSTPVGMASATDPAAAQRCPLGPLELAALQPRTLVYDLIYTPRPSQLLRQAAGDIGGDAGIVTQQDFDALAGDGGGVGAQPGADGGVDASGDLRDILVDDVGDDAVRPAEPLAEDEARGAGGFAFEVSGGAEHDIAEQRFAIDDLVADHSSVEFRLAPDRRLGR